MGPSPDNGLDYFFIRNLDLRTVRMVMVDKELKLIHVGQ